MTSNNTPDPLAYGPTGVPCGCGKDAHSNLVPCQPDPLTGQQLDEIEAWTKTPLGPGLAAEQQRTAALIAEVRRLRAESERRTEDLAAADNPTPLRWGLNDVIWGDDDTVTVLLSGPGGEPYWLELDPERAAVLRQDLAGPPAEEQQAVEASEAVIRASEIELEGGDVMLQEMSVGDPIEIEKQTGPMRPGCWVITAFETEDRNRARVRRLTRAEIEAARRREAVARIYE